MKHFLCHVDYSVPFFSKRKIYIIPLVILKSTLLSSTVDANEQHYQLSIIGENCDQKNRMTKGNPLNRKHSYATLCMLAVSFSHFTNAKFPIYFHCNFSMTFFFSMQNGQIPKGRKNTWIGRINYRYGISTL